MRIETAPILLIFLVPSLVYGWGEGHDQVNELAVEMLREVLPVESGVNAVRWSHTPDDFTPWEKLKEFQVSPEDRQLLKAHKLQTAYSSHSAKGQVVEFILLVNAFKQNDPQRIHAAMWTMRLKRW